MASVSLASDGTEHGALHPGWSQEESASPHVLGDSSGETRQTTFSAQATADSDLLIGKPLGLTGPFDTTGVALSSTLVGDRIETSAYDIDSKFLPVRTFYPVNSGYEEAALDMFQRVYGSGGLTLPWKPTGQIHAYYPLRGYGQGFVPDGGNTPHYQTTWGEGVVYSTPNATYYWGRSGAPATHYIRLASGVYATTARVMHSLLTTGTNVNYQSMRVRLIPGSFIRSRINIAWSGVETSIDIDIAGTTGTAGSLTVSGAYRQFGAGSATPITAAVAPLTGLSTANEIGLVFQWGYLTNAVDSTLRVKAYAFDPLSPPVGAPTIVAQVDLPNAMRGPLGSQNGTITRNVAGAVAFRDLVLSQSDNSWPVHYPVPDEPSLLDVDIDTSAYLNLTSPKGFSAREGGIHGWTGSGWDYLKMLCTGRALTTRILNGKLAVRNLFPIADVQPVMNAIDEPVLSINATDRSRSIDIVQHGSIARRSFGIVSADPPVMYEVNIDLDLNEEFTHTIDLPEGDYQIGTIVPSVINDTNGRSQKWVDLWNAGGRMVATVSPDNVLTMTFRGPSRENVAWTSGAYTGYGPWRIGLLSLSNQGVVENNSTVALYTGAPDEMVTREKGGNVDNPFLCTQADVFDRSTWLISSEGSPAISLSFAVPAEHRARYTVGQIVSYGWGHFRVMRVSHGRGVTQVDCDWFATQAEQSANWAGQSANQWNTYWSGKRAYDVFIRPLASPVPVLDPQPFVRSYPSESTLPGVPTILVPGGSVFGTGVFGSGTPYGY